MSDLAKFRIKYVEELARVQDERGSSHTYEPASGGTRSAHPEDVKDTPILTLYREYRRISEAAARHVCITDNPDEELERLFWRERDGIEEVMVSLPSTCAADFAAKMIVETDRAAIVQDWEEGRMWIEARALTGTPV